MKLENAPSDLPPCYKNHQKTSKKHPKTSTNIKKDHLVFSGHLVFGGLFLASLIKNSSSLHRRTTCSSHRRTTSAQSRSMNTACKTLPLGCITPLASKQKYPRMIRSRRGSLCFFARRRRWAPAGPGLLYKIIKKMCLCLQNRLVRSSICRLSRAWMAVGYLFESSQEEVCLRPCMRSILNAVFRATPSSGGRGWS